MAHSGHTFRHLGRRTALVGALQYYGGTGTYVGSGFPNSGTSGTTVINGAGAPAFATYVDADTGVEFVNEGTAASPYWTPKSFDQPGLLGVYDDFRGPDLMPIANTVESSNAPSGVRCFGAELDETDGGVLQGTNIEGTHVGVMRTSNADEDTVCLGMGSSVAMVSPDTTGLAVVDIEWAQLTDILTRRIFVGFAGEVQDTMVSLATGATTVITFAATSTEGDDLTGFFMDSNLTDANGLFLIHNKSNAAATIATTATGVDPSESLGVAGTYQRMRVELAANGNATFFLDKVQVGQHLIALDVDEECAPIAQLAVEQGTTILNATVKQFSCWTKASARV